MARLRINQRDYDVDAPDDMPLLWALRDILNLTGTKFGCGIGACGACTVHLDGVAQRSCTVPIADAAGVEIETIEGLGGGELHPVQQAWIRNNVPQCGYCQPGMIMQVADLLSQRPTPSEQQIDESLSNICRCGTYPQIRRTIQELVRNSK